LIAKAILSYLLPIYRQLFRHVQSSTLYKDADMLTCRKRRYQQLRLRRVRHRPKTNAMQTAQQSVWLRPRRPRAPRPRRWLVFRLKLTAHFKSNTNIVVSVVNDQYLRCHKNVNHLFSFLRCNSYCSIVCI